jgi:DNA-binding XRE family transcriptional regulator
MVRVTKQPSAPPNLRMAAIWLKDDLRDLQESYARLRRTLVCYRTWHKLTQSQLAERLGIERGVVAKVECGIRKPSAALIARLIGLDEEGGSNDA